LTLIPIEVVVRLLGGVCRAAIGILATTSTRLATTADWRKVFGKPALYVTHWGDADPSAWDDESHFGRCRLRRGSPLDAQQGLIDLAIVSLLAALTPILAGLLSRRVPQVVILILGGILIGPEVFGWADPESLELVSDVGLGFLFLLAGYELELELFRERAGRLAMKSWLVTVVVALAVTGALAAVGFVHAFVPIAIGLTTTALGTLLPILRDNQMLEGRFGGFIMAAGAVGEFLPIVAIAIFLSAKGAFLGLISLVVVAGVALLFTFVPRLVRHERIRRIVAEGEHATSQTTLRWTIFLLFALLVIAANFGLDVVLGAFLAGVVLRRWAPGDVHALEGKLDAVGYGFFIPVFFVASGMSLDLKSIIESPARLVVFFVLFLVVRGLPALLFYRHDLPMRGRVQMMLLTATALPLLVALAKIGLDSGEMLPENAAALVGAGVLSVIVFPAIAAGLARSRTHPLVDTRDGS
jgi:Kef-type K+ transport system membrane component KefB